MSIPKPIHGIGYTDLIDNFPLKGQYVFRAKYKQGKEVLWFDLDKQATKIPADDGSIFLKVKRISWETLTRKENGNREQSKVNQNASNSVPKRDEGFEFDLDNSPPAPSSFIPKGNQTKQQKENLDGFDLSGFEKNTPGSKAKTNLNEDIMGLDLGFSGLGSPNKQVNKPSNGNGLNMDDLLL